MADAILIQTETGDEVTIEAAPFEPGGSSIYLAVNTQRAYLKPHVVKDVVRFLVAYLATVEGENGT